jgi:hypothetical protein
MRIGTRKFLILSFSVGLLQTAIGVPAHAIEFCCGGRRDGYSQDEGAKVDAWIASFNQQVTSRPAFRDVAQELLARLKPSGEYWCYFGVIKTGEVSGIRFHRALGWKELDDSIIHLFEDAAPFEPPPSGIDYRLIAYFKITSSGDIALISRLDKFIINPDAYLRNP